MCPLRYKPKTSKSKSMDVKMNDTKITQSDAYEYLGVMAEENQTYTDHLQKIAKKATSRVKLLSQI